MKRLLRTLLGSIRLLPFACAAVLMTGGTLSAGENASDVPDLKKLSIEELMTIEVETVYSASKYEQKVTEAPSSVTIITANDVRKYGYRTLADILKSVRGFSVTYDRNYSHLGIRGFGRPGDYNSRVLLLVDGHRINDNAYDTAPIGTEFILDVDLIDRVEISRGPNSSLYGSNAFFAVVNLITRRGRELNGAVFSGEAGSFKTVKGRASLGTKWQNGGDAFISGTGYYSKGDRLYFPEFDQRNSFADLRAGNDGIAEYRDYDRFQTAFAKLSSRGFTFEGAYSSRIKGIPTGAYGSDFNVPGNQTMNRRAYADLKYDRTIGKQTDMTVRIFSDYSEYSADYLYTGTVNKDWSYGMWMGGEVKLSTRLYDIHRVILGAEYDSNQRQDQRNADQFPSTLFLDDERRSRTWASYIQDEITLSPAVMLNAGIRYDYTSSFGETVNPRFAAILNPAAGSTVKLLYGSAFRSPNVYELYYQTAASSPPLASNPNLKPEKIKTYELVYEQYLEPGIRATVDGYYYTIDDLINQTLDTAVNLVFENIEEVDARGLELELEKRWASGADGRVSYALQRATNARTGEPLLNSPEQLAKLNILLPLRKDRVFAGLEEQYTSRRKTLSGKHVDDFFLTNLTVLGRNVSRTVEVSMSVYNLFNKKYDDPASFNLVPLDTVRQEGRTVRVKFTYAF